MRFFSVSPIYLLMTNENPFLEIWNRSLGRVDGWCGSMQVLESPQRFLAFDISYDFLNTDSQFGHILLRYLPNRFKINTEIVMDENIPKPGNSTPGYF
jgi:hypothetical protein